MLLDFRIFWEKTGGTTQDIQDGKDQFQRGGGSTGPRRADLSLPALTAS
jgi:hypothetical protein